MTAPESREAVEAAQFVRERFANVRERDAIRIARARAMGSTCLSCDQHFADHADYLGHDCARPMRFHVIPHERGEESK